MEVESAEDRAERLEHEKENLQSRLDEALKAQQVPKVPKRSRAEADDPGTREGQEVAEQGKQAKAEAADELDSEANIERLFTREYRDLSVRVWYLCPKSYLCYELVQVRQEGCARNACRAG